MLLPGDFGAHAQALCSPNVGKADSADFLLSISYLNGNGIYDAIKTSVLIVSRCLEPATMVS